MDKPPTQYLVGQGFTINLADSKPKVVIHRRARKVLVGSKVSVSREQIFAYEVLTDGNIFRVENRRRVEITEAKAPDEYQWVRKALAFIHGHQFGGVHPHYRPSDLVRWFTEGG